MTANTHAGTPQGTIATLRRDVGLPGRIAISWTAAGGFLLGGILIAVMTLGGQMSGSGLLMTSSGLFLIGSFLGFAHGSVLGFLGRPEGESRKEALHSLGLGAIYCIPVLAIGLVVAGWIAMTVVSLYTASYVAMGISAVAWLIAAAVVVSAARQGWTGLRNGYARWPERKLGTVLVATAFAALAIIFLAERPVLWGLQLRVTEVGAIALALFGTIWVAGPVVTMALFAARQVQVPALEGASEPAMTRWFPTSAVVGLVAGVVLGLVALPFFGAPLMVTAPVVATGILGTLVVSASRALIDEVLLRLFLVSSVAWLMLRWKRVSAGEAAVAAVLTGAVVQLALYLPWIMGIGFPTMTTAAGFVLMVVIVPAIAFGALYLKRGFGTALLAHATMIAMLALLAT
jgi:hypothetical protein